MYYSLSARERAEILRVQPSIQRKGSRRGTDGLRKAENLWSTFRGQAVKMRLLVIFEPLVSLFTLDQSPNPLILHISIVIVGCRFEFCCSARRVTGHETEGESTTFTVADCPTSLKEPAVSQARVETRDQVVEMICKGFSVVIVRILRSGQARSGKGVFHIY